MSETEVMAKEQKTIEVALNINPVPKARARVTKRGFSYTPKKTKDFENAVKILFRKQYQGKPMTGALHINAEFFFEKPKKPVHSYPSRCDLDNVLKNLTDSLNGLAWVDDRQICSIVCEKNWAPSGNPGYIRLSVSIYAQGYAESSD
jgi:crossover junction endodeoxyribonuclease RusA